MIINFLKNISIATVSTAAISFSLISANPAQAATFTSEIEYDLYDGNTLEFTFDNLNQAIGDVTLSVFAEADIEKKWETVRVSIYSGNSFTDLGNVFDNGISDWGGVVLEDKLDMARGVDTLTISESLFNSLDQSFTIQLTPNWNVFNDKPSYAYVELDYVEKIPALNNNVEKVPEPGTIAGLSLLGLGGLMIKKKPSYTH